MKQYPKYKNSGVQWIGQIPEHWKAYPIKWYLQLCKGNKPAELVESGDEPYVTMDYIRNRENKVCLFPADTEGLVHIEDNDILILWDGANAGEVVLGKKGYLSSTMALCSFDSTVANKEFGYYFLKSLEPIFKQYAGGTTIPHFDSSVLFEYTYPLPSLAEQQAIAQFLDSKTAKIDESISLYEQQKADLVEYRKALISDTVTRGLNPNGPMKDSGVQWIGQIPEMWRMSKIKHCCDVFGRIGFRGYTTDDMVTAGEGAITLSPSNIKDGKMSFDKLAYLSWDKYNESPEIQIHVGDILLTKTGSSYGKCAYVDYLPMEATINPQFVVLKHFQENARYLAYVMQTPMIKKQEEDSVVGGAIPTMAQEDINNFVLPLPSHFEQQEIVTFLDDKTSKIDEAILRIDEQIADLRAYRTALITDAVTGKIDVRTAK